MCRGNMPRRWSRALPAMTWCSRWSRTAITACRGRKISSGLFGPWRSFESSSEARRASVGGSRGRSEIIPLATRGVVQSERPRAIRDHVEKAAGHHQVLIKMRHVFHVAGGQMDTEGGAEAEQDQQARGPGRHEA